MTSPGRVFLVTGAVLAAAAIAMGAFGAHALRAVLDQDRMAVYQTAVQYHLWQALGVLMIGVAIALGRPLRLLTSGGWLMVAGMVIFSGSLYALTLTGERAFGALTPLGGVAMIVGWLLVGVAFLRR